MPFVVGVRFGNNKKVYTFDPAGESYSEGDIVIVDTQKGNEMGDVVKVDMVKKDYLIMVMNEYVTKERVLGRILNSTIKIEQFGIYEPSLNDIFVAKVGDDNA